MEANQNQTTEDNQIFDLTKVESIPNRDQQITINDPIEKQEQKVEENTNNTQGKEKLEMEQIKSDSI